MKICVQGLWHLGTVTAACLADAGFDVIGLDDNAQAVSNLSLGIPPLFEPGLEDLTRKGLQSGKLAFTTDAAAAVREADVVWVAFDTPVDDDDRADIEFVKSRVRGLFPTLKQGAVVLISSQLPVGSIRQLEQAFAQTRLASDAHFACSPENLRLGKAIQVFTRSERIIVGVRSEAARPILEKVLLPFCGNLIWTRVESAEMVKHALNAFLATCVTYTNEVASLCEQVGADAEEVERALRSEPRVGPNAYVHAGAAFAGGTLARDVVFLGKLAREHSVAVPLLDGIIPSNAQHRRWTIRQLQQHAGNVKGKTIAVLGLSYKAGTDAIRRSVAIETCRALLEQGAQVRAYDPQVRILPPDLAAIQIATSLDDALKGSDALIIATEWPEFRNVSAELIATEMRIPLVIDQNRFLPPQAVAHSRIRYVTIGKPA